MPNIFFDWIYLKINSTFALATATTYKTTHLKNKANNNANILIDFFIISTLIYNNMIIMLYKPYH